MKRLISIAVSLILIFSSIAPSLAESEIKVALDGTTLAFDADPFISNSRTMVPFRAIFEALGATVEWNADSNTVTGTKGELNIVLTINSPQATVSGENVGLDTAPQVKNGRTFVPTRFVAENLGVRVYWNKASSTVVLLSDKIDTSLDNSYIEATNPTNTEPDSPIEFWYFNKDEGPYIVDAYNSLFPNKKVNLTLIPDKDQQYQNKLTAAFKSGSGTPDVVGLESAFVKQFVDMPGALDNLTEKSKNITSNMYQYTIDVGKDKNGVLRALSHQITSIAIGFKKQLALKYLGTNDPAKISNMISTPDKILETAAKLKSKSGGKVTLFPTFEELLISFLGSRSQGWVSSNNNFVMDQKMLDFMDLAKKMRDNKYESGLERWSPNWSVAIANDATSMCWLIPTWGIPWIIGCNDKKSANGGRWALANPPYQGFWGGTWFGINSKSPNKQNTFDFIKAFTSNQELMKKWSIENQDHPNHKSLMNQLSSDSKNISKITGQNNYKIFLSLTPKVNGKLLTQYDTIIENVYINIMRSYLAGKIKSRDEAIRIFKDQVKTYVDDIYIK
ncbi:extracellular solute-binding protein [Pseudobacteroides cellulosolvens]|uniref:Copper amine oxidase-like domain-containing protein n=1 Tax=Pseudobacteroides cellulosolvens ATCC 35603 = DSM 2933 TaxID=398512 RepID=A0A0L6JG92_9FIRM|nr:extracellular solute-binding protein [Pseudobacteroides cellulosolvens]KNY24896.1 copper amine oxidase-like domain-containing protein [Pseudobacteroides cellulosolvens ATCC 35603 = DSM 2933]